jgi:hypothetical protein
MRQPCLVYALTTHQEFWIWGGWDENERRLLHRQRRETRGAAVLAPRGSPPGVWKVVLRKPAVTWRSDNAWA